jgi:hypothetical protein
MSQWKPVTTVRADCEFAIALRVPPPPVPVPPPSPPPRGLKRRCGGRHFFHGRRVDRSGTRTRSPSNRKPSRQAEKEECVAHECSPESSPVGNDNASDVAVRRMFTFQVWQAARAPRPSRPSNLRDWNLPNFHAFKAHVASRGISRPCSRGP